MRRENRELDRAHLRLISVSAQVRPRFERDYHRRMRGLVGKQLVDVDVG